MCARKNSIHNPSWKNNYKYQNKQLKGASNLLLGGLLSFLLSPGSSKKNGNITINDDDVIVYPIILIISFILSVACLWINFNNLLLGIILIIPTTYIHVILLWIIWEIIRRFLPENFFQSKVKCKENKNSKLENLYPLIDNAYELILEKYSQEKHQYLSPILQKLRNFDNGIERNHLIMILIEDLKFTTKIIDECFILLQEQKDIWISNETVYPIFSSNYTIFSEFDKAFSKLYPNHKKDIAEFQLKESKMVKELYRHLEMFPEDVKLMLLHILFHGKSNYNKNYYRSIDYLTIQFGLSIDTIYSALDKAENLGYIIKDNKGYIINI